MTVYALCADLFFSARIRETAKQLGTACEVFRDPAAVVARVVEAPPGLVIVDMNLKTGDAAAAVRALKAAAAGVQVVGFLHDSHDELIRAARAAGCDKVLSRGGLTAKLPDLLKGRS
jgi:DNA-binding NarL/FixJ family response regulator